MENLIFFRSIYIISRRQSLNDLENFEEKFGAKSHILMNGKTVLDYGETPSKIRGPCFLPSSRTKKGFDTQISKETQISAIVSDEDEDFAEDGERERPCL